MWQAHSFINACRNRYARSGAGNGLQRSTVLLGAEQSPKAETDPCPHPARVCALGLELEYAVEDGLGRLQPAFFQQQRRDRNERFGVLRRELRNRLPLEQGQLPVAVRQLEQGQLAARRDVVGAQP